LEREASHLPAPRACLRLRGVCMVWYFETGSVGFINRLSVHRTHCAVLPLPAYIRLVLEKQKIWILNLIEGIMKHKTRLKAFALI
jgi:hypothetical protein